MLPRWVPNPSLGTSAKISRRTERTGQKQQQQLLPTTVPTPRASTSTATPTTFRVRTSSRRISNTSRPSRRKTTPGTTCPRASGWPWCSTIPSSSSRTTRNAAGPSRTVTPSDKHLGGSWDLRWDVMAVLVYVKARWWFDRYICNLTSSIRRKAIDLNCRIFTQGYFIFVIGNSCPWFCSFTYSPSVHFVATCLFTYPKWIFFCV